MAKRTITEYYTGISVVRDFGDGVFEIQNANDKIEVVESDLKELYLLIGDALKHYVKEQPPSIDVLPAPKVQARPQFKPAPMVLE